MKSKQLNQFFVKWTISDRWNSIWNFVYSSEAEKKALIKHLKKIHSNKPVIYDSIEELCADGGVDLKCAKKYWNHCNKNLKIATTRKG